jgi:hypothetical protein
LWMGRFASRLVPALAMRWCALVVVLRRCVCTAVVNGTSPILLAAGVRSW